jgi:hypothetical protein
MMGMITKMMMMMMMMMKQKNKKHCLCIATKKSEGNKLAKYSNIQNGK